MQWEFEFIKRFIKEFNLESRGSFSVFVWNLGGYVVIPWEDDDGESILSSVFSSLYRR